MPTDLRLRFLLTLFILLVGFKQVQSTACAGPKCASLCLDCDECQLCDDYGSCLGSECPAAPCASTYYGDDCTKRCSTYCFNRLCHEDTGACYSCTSGRIGSYCVCPSTYYGDTCAYRCSSNCVNRECNDDTGACHNCPSGRTGSYCDQDCSATYFGSRCTQRCSTNCVNQLCDKVTGVCDQCPSGKTGDQCDKDCPRFTYGQDCLQTCSENCVNRLCDPINGFCDQCLPGKTGNKCDQDCPYPKYGQDCQQTCSVNCKDQRCNVENGICQQCLPGRTGDFCDQDCQDFRYGPNCTQVCSTNCVDRLCDKVNGVCNECPPGKTGDQCDKACPVTYYGSNCEQTCSSNCVDRLCDKVNGVCDTCPPGKTGDMCNQDCPYPKYGQDCQQTCSVNCKDQRCNVENGICQQCLSGRTGDFCDQDCSPTTYGSGCNKTCSVNCFNQNCDSVDGACSPCLERYGGDRCEQELCPMDFCKNGGKCIGHYLCDCTSTAFFGDMCQYTKQEIPISKYDFASIVNNTITTSSGNQLTANGNVTLNKDGGDLYLSLPSGSYVTPNEPISECLNNLDDCKSGFTITVNLSFSQLDKVGRQVVLTTGAGLESGVQGVSLFYQSGYVNFFVVTSTQVWSIIQPFELAEDTLYEITISWHPDQGILLLNGKNVIGSSNTSTTSTQDAEAYNSLTIGSGDYKSSSTVINIQNFITSPVFVKEIERSGIMINTVQKISSDSTAFETAQIIGIAVGCAAALVIAVVAVVGLLLYKKRKSKMTKSPPGGFRQADDGYITAVSDGYSTVSSQSGTGYNSVAAMDDTPSQHYDYIKDDYVTIES